MAPRKAYVVLLRDGSMLSPGGSTDFISLAHMFNREADAKATCMRPEKKFIGSSVIEVHCLGECFSPEELCAADDFVSNICGNVS